MKTLRGRVTFTGMNFRGRLLYPEQWKMELTGSVVDAVYASTLFPGRFSLAHAGFKATMSTVSVNDAQLSYLDSWITASGTVTGGTVAVRSLDLALGGEIGREGAAWAFKTFSLPAAYLTRTPVSLTSVRMTWKRGADLSLAGNAKFRTGTTLGLDMRTGRGGFHVKRLAIDRQGESALLSVSSTADMLDLSFRGSLTQETLDRIFEKAPLHLGWLRGDMRVQLALEKPGRSKAQGSLAGSGLLIEPKPGQPVMIREIALRANSRTVTVEKASLLWADTLLEVKGRVSAAEEGIRADLDVATGSLELNRIIDAFSLPEQEREKPAEGPLPVQGMFRISANDLGIGKFLFAPVKADVFLDRNSVRINVLDAGLCGIVVTGHIQPLDQDLLLDLQPIAVGRQLEPLVDCLSSTKRITGTYSLIGKFHGKGKSSDLMRSINGHAEFTAKDGRFYTFPLLARILAFLNVTELLRGKLPDMGRDGFAYQSVRIKGDMKNGKLILREAVVVGSTLNLAAEGQIDFTNNTLDVTVLVAPFKTIEFILSKIPVIRHLLANRLITVPVRLTGDLNNPDVTPLDPAAIGQNLLGIMRGILSLPFKVLDPLLHPGD